MVLAHQLHVPIIPMGRSKRVGLWGKLRICFGEPLFIEGVGRKLTQEEIERGKALLREKVIEQIRRAEEHL